MAVGKPDWYSDGLAQTIPSVTDIGELAARLGSEINFDRTGKVLFRDVFIRFDELWKSAGVGITAGPIVDTLIALYGGSSLKTTLAAGAGNYFTVYRDFRIWDNTRLSLEIGGYSTKVPTEVWLYLLPVSGSREYLAQIKFTDDCTKVYYYNSAGADVLLDTYTYSLFSLEMWYAIKLTLDTQKWEYKELRVNAHQYDMRGLQLSSGDYIGDDHVRMYMRVQGQVGAYKFYLDRVVLTEDE